MAWAKLKNGKVQRVDDDELRALVRGGHAEEVDSAASAPRPLSGTELAPRNLAGPRKIYSAFAPGAKSRYDTDEARASAYAQSLAAQGIEPSWAVQQFPRAASVVRSGAPGLSGLARLLYAGAKDLSSEPGRAIASRVQQGINTLRGTPNAGKTISFGMADPTGAAIGQNNFVTGIARDPFLLPSMALTGGKALAPRIAGGLAVGLGAPMLERAADYDASTTWAPTTNELAAQGALAIMPDALGTLGARLAPAFGRKAKELFMSEVKALPGKRNRQVWEAMDRFSDNPQYVREIIGDRSQYPELAQGWREGTAARQARVEPIYDEMETRGVRVPVEAALAGMRDEMRGLSRGAATGQERQAAAQEMEHLLTQPDPMLYPLGALGEDVPPVLAYAPREARGIKSDAYGRVRDWNDPAASAKSAAAAGAGRGIKDFLEASDPTGTLAAKNREWGDWLGTEEGFLRMESRAANRERLAPWQIVKAARRNPQSVRRLLDLQDIANDATRYGVNLSPFARSLFANEMGDYE